MQISFQPKVSILIPAYNEEKYIAQTLSAVMEQDYPDYEIIVVNNASSDKTKDVVEKFIHSTKDAERKIKLLYEGRKGTQFARECGRKAALGAIIAQLDADCVPGKNWLSLGVGFMKNNVVAITGPYFYYDSSLKIKIITLLTSVLFLKFINQLVQLAHRGGIIIGGNAFIKADVLEKVDGYNTALTFYGDDADIALRVSAFGQIKFLNKLMINSSSRRYKAMGFSQVQKKYNQFFFRSVFNGYKPSLGHAELYHPR
ncbi:MAG: hypothetical protein NVS1B13_11020 [Flavisolibacter sp.]